MEGALVSKVQENRAREERYKMERALESKGQENRAREERYEYKE